jgi:hypothetical protein
MATVLTTLCLVHTAILVLLELVAIIARDLRPLIVELEPHTPGTTVRDLLVPTRFNVTGSKHLR